MFSIIYKKYYKFVCGFVTDWHLKSIGNLPKPEDADAGANADAEESEEDE